MRHLNVDVPDAPPIKDIGGLTHPFVRHPLGAKEHGTAAVEHCHVGSAAALDIVPKHCRALGRRYSDSESWKSRVSPFPHLGEREKNFVFSTYRLMSKIIKSSLTHVGKVKHEGSHSVAGDVVVLLGFAQFGHVVWLLVNKHGVLVCIVMSADPIVGNLRDGHRR